MDKNKICQLTFFKDDFDQFSTLLIKAESFDQKSLQIN